MSVCSEDNITKLSTPTSSYYEDDDEDDEDDFNIGDLDEKVDLPVSGEKHF